MYFYVNGLQWLSRMSCLSVLSYCMTMMRMSQSTLVFAAEIEEVDIGLKSPVFSLSVRLEIVLGMTTFKSCSFVSL